MMFYRSHDPTSSVKALKESGQSSEQLPISPGSPYPATVIQYASCGVWVQRLWFAPMRTSCSFKSLQNSLVEHKCYLLL